MTIAAIDPGSTGAIVILSEPIQIYVPPTIGKKMDWAGYARLFDKLEDCFVGLEEVHSIFGASAKSNFTFGGMFYSAMCLLHSKGIRHEMIPPKKWQSEIWSATDRVYKAGKVNKTVDTKATSLLAAKRLYPTLDFLYGDNEQGNGRRTKPHDGIVDALLIAEFCRRTFNYE